MHLKSMELTGFKSFAEGKIEFPKGVTAIVGPNGVGKSNIVDAILWVLGEQSTKTLRSERMEDVIFNGTETRKPLGMAEVSLIISGIADQRIEGVQALPFQLGDFHEVMVTRRLYRNGDSEYLINKTLCRLKDVRSLFLDTRAGSKGHTVIEQGRIDQILNASPQERRELIEETAGIVRYKKQKAEALRKLESTHQNLLRVRDIVGEVRRQLNSLERQAKQARVYQTLQQEARTLEIRLLVRELCALRDRQAEVEADLAEMETKESGLAADEGRLNSEHEALRLKMVEGESAATRLRESLSQVEHRQAQALTAVEVERGRLELFERQRSQAEEDLHGLNRAQEEAGAALADLRTRVGTADLEITERTQALADLEGAAQELAGRRTAAMEEEQQARRRLLDVAVEVSNAESAVAGLERQAGEIGRRGERLAEEVAELERQRAGVLARLQGLALTREEHTRRLEALTGEREAAAQALHLGEETLSRTDHLLAQQQEELAALGSRLRALQGVLREEMGYGREGEEATSLRAACGGVRAAVAEWLVVPAGLERAIEAVLGERVRAWLVESPAEAREAIAFLKDHGLGRGAFVPVRPRWGAPDAPPPWWPALRSQPGVRGLVVDLIQGTAVSGEAGGEALACLFQGVVLVETFEDALALWNANQWTAPDGPTLVTLEGEVLDASGVVTGGPTAPSGGLLQRRREIQTLEAEQGELARTVEATRRTRDQAVQDSQASKSELQRLDLAIRDMEMHVLACSKDEAGLGESVEGLGERLATVRSEREALDDERRRVQEALDADRARLARLAEERQAGEAGLAELARAVQALQEEGAVQQQRITEARLAVAGLRARREHDEADLARLGKEQQEREARVATLRQELEAVLAAAHASQAERDRSQALFRDLDRRAVAMRAELTASQEAQARDLEVLCQVEQDLSQVREALTAGRKRRTDVEVRRAEIKTHLETVEGTLTDTYQLSVEAALALESNTPGARESRPSGSFFEEEPEGPSLKDELQKIRDRLQRMGPINLASIEEHQGLEERHRFLVAQEEDLSNSIRSLRQIIARINRTTKQMFTDTFNELQQKFGEVFVRFFPGGRAELILVEPQAEEESPEGGSQEPGVEIVAQPPGKRLKSITMLSGGEKTLTAMALIFASFLIRPTPFCILDEIDAPMDEENIGRFTTVLRELAEGAQFLVVTHNKRTMGVADSLFGVTMEEPGISKLVSVRLGDLQPA